MKSQESIDCNKASDLIKTIEKFHYSPKEIDSIFINNVFNKWIDKNDPYKLLFSETEIDKINALKPKFKAFIQGNSCVLINELSNILQFALNDLVEFFDSQSISNFDFIETQSFATEIDAYPLKYEDLINRRNSWIKYRLLEKYFSDSTRMYDLDPDRSVLENNLDQFQRRIKCAFSEDPEEDNYRIKNVHKDFLDAIAYCFDPHTSYMPPQEKSEFEDLISTEFFSYGFEVIKNDLEEIEISYIYPGSAAWRSNKLNEGDIIEWVNDTLGYVEFNCISLNTVNNQLNRNDIKKGTFGVRKKNGKKIELTLVKSEIEQEENAIQSFILGTDSKLGYLYLPSFYTNLESDHAYPNGCANDIAKEILKLERENIDGLIIDLRNNGGGSLLEAIRLSGMFINFGAVGIQHYRNEDPGTLKDTQRGSAYNGPLIIIVNQFSASASEFLASSLQEHNRAIVIGANTYGKGTIQRVMPINQHKYAIDSDVKNASGFVKLTVGKFFKPSGKTVQKIGVLPDIVLPTYYDSLEMGESIHLSVLDSNSITKKTYYKPYPEFPLSDLKEQSKARVNNSMVFSSLKNETKRFFVKNKLYRINLKFQLFRDEYLSRYIFEYAQIDDELFEVSNPSYIDRLRTFTNIKAEENKSQLFDLSTDPYIFESYNIMQDLLQTLNH